MGGDDACVRACVRVCVCLCVCVVLGILGLLSYNYIEKHGLQRQ